MSGQELLALDDLGLSCLSDDGYDGFLDVSQQSSCSIPQSPDLSVLLFDITEDSSLFPELDMFLDTTSSIHEENIDSDEPQFGFIPDASTCPPDAPSGTQSYPWWDDHVMEEFFLKNGATRPPAPCDHCRRRKLQCFLIQTTPFNPNPTTACSSCVGLYRECSLARSLKRQPLSYETRQPVINHLHGIHEEENIVLPDERSARTKHISGPGSASRRSSGSRLVRRTRALRKWFAAHVDDPYPTEEERVELVRQSGLTRTQVVNWFNNARRRQRYLSQIELQYSRKVFRSGSPMPQPTLDPRKQWHSDSSDKETGSLQQSIERLGNVESDGQDCAGSYTGSSISELSFFTSTSFDQNGSSSSAPQCPSVRPSNSSLHLQFLSGHDSVTPASHLTASKKERCTFQCTFCHQGFKKRHDWLRHERSMHLSGLSSWICDVPLEVGELRLVWRVGRTEPECAFCGSEGPDEEHFQTHEFEICAERPEAERTFKRKDHLWQHLYKFHSCRKWTGWKSNLKHLRHRVEMPESRCGFCQCVMSTWDDRADHLAVHFRAGLTMAQWIGGSNTEASTED